MSAPRLTLGDEVESMLASVSKARAQMATTRPGAAVGRQPVHSVYGGAQLFRADLVDRFRKSALASLSEHAPDPFIFARATGMEGAAALPDKKKTAKPFLDRFAKKPDAMRTEDPLVWRACAVYERVRQKLEREPIEDFRIDFEDGFGIRPDEEEDAVVLVCADQLRKAMANGDAPPFIGIRLKPLNDELGKRSLRTLDLFVTHLVAGEGSRLPDPFIVTLPKVSMEEEVRAVCEAIGRLESRLKLTPGVIRVELMIELTTTLFDAEGRLNLLRLVNAAQGRCLGAHFGTYDYTASAGITASEQRVDHPSCRLALGLMRIGLSDAGVFLSDGATNILPVPLHRAPDEGELTKREVRENRDAVHRAWALSFRNVQRALAEGYYQGWDLHPAQLPVRYAAVYDFFLRGMNAAAERLRNFIDKAAQATRVGEVFDDAATGQGLLNFFLQARACGAITEEEAAMAGLTAEDMQTRSFLKILERRR